MSLDKRAVLVLKTEDSESQWIVVVECDLGDPDFVGYNQNICGDCCS